MESIIGQLSEQSDIDLGPHTQAKGWRPTSGIVFFCHTSVFPSLQPIFVAIFLGGLSIIDRVSSGHIWVSFCRAGKMAV